jgi:hypothetical protein
MAPSSSYSSLARRARRAYERARLVDAAVRAAPVALIVAVVAASSEAPGWRLWLGGAAVIAATLAFWRGQILARAAKAGILAALAPLAVPFVADSLHRGCDCARLPLAACMLLCVGGGAIAGAIMAVLAAREREADRWRFASTAAIMAAWLGTLGCAFAGAAGMLGMAGGLLAIGAPLLVLSRAAR